MLLDRWAPGEGRVTSYGGDIWPGSLPEVFEKRGAKTAADPNNTYVKDEIRAHFHESTAAIEIEN